MAGLSARCPHCGALGLEGAAFCVECGGRMPAAKSDHRSTQSFGEAPPSARRTAITPAPTAPTVVSAALDVETLIQQESGSPAPTSSAATVESPLVPPPEAYPTFSGRAEPSRASTSPLSASPLAPQRPPAPSSLPGVGSKRPPPLRRSTAPGTLSRAPSKPAPSANPGSISEALAAATQREGALEFDAGPVTKPGPTIESSAPTSPSASPLPFPAVTAELEPPPLLTRELTAADDASSPSRLRLHEDIDRGFENLTSEPPGAGSDLSAQELAEAQRLFLEIAANYLGPVRNLVLEIELGEPSKDWLAVCRPAVNSLRRAADDMDLQALARGLSALLEAIDQADRQPGQLLDARARGAIRDAYLELAATLPQAFSFREERDRREPVIVQTLLLQVSDVRKVALDRLYAAGLTSLDMFFKAKPTDIAEAAGVPRELAERIVARFQRYRRELTQSPPTPQHGRERSQVETLMRKLAEQNQAFDATSQSLGHGEEKRRLRQERAATVLELNLVLARLGEVTLIERLERLPFQKKVDELKQYLAKPVG